MTEEQIRAIVQDEIKKNSNSGSPDVPAHSHNGTDGLPVSFSDLEGVKLFRQMDVASGLPSFETNTTPIQSTAGAKSTNPIPIIVGHGVGVYSQFNGGDAPDGTILLFANGATLSSLFVRFDSQWYQFNVDAVV